MLHETVPRQLKYTKS